MPTPLEYYLENYSPPSQKVTFTWKTQTFEWNPKYLAAVSTLYPTIPQTPVFEINARKTIKTDRAATIFHRLMPAIPGWDETKESTPSADFEDLIDDDGSWLNGVEEMISLYCALELCDYLGIKADLRFFQAGFDGYRKSNKETIVSDIIAEHQLFLATNFEEGIKQCEYILRIWYGPPVEDYKSHCANTDVTYQNETYRCKIAAYIEFAGPHYEQDRVQYNGFLRQYLGWTTKNEKFGIQIILPDNVDETNGDNDEEIEEE